jgi:hypothetical protein
VGVLRKALVGLLVWAGLGRTAAVEDSPGVGIPDLEGDNPGFEEDNLGPEGSLEEGHLGFGADHRCHNMNRKVNGHQGRHHLGHRRTSH